MFSAPLSILGSLFAQASAGAVSTGASKHFMEYGRAQETWQWIAPLAVLGALMVFTWFIYLRDCAEIHWAIAAFLMGLRMAAFVGLFWIYLDPRWRVEEDIEQDWRLLVLVDTSQSMGLNDTDSGSVPSGPSRAQRVIAALSEGKLLDQLRRAHEVVLIRFDSDKQVLNSLSRIKVGADGKLDPDEVQRQLAEKVDWKKLEPRLEGKETRLGEALRDIINDHRAAPVAGVIVFTDGQSNVGLEPESAIRDAKLQIFTVGIGSDQHPINAQIAGLNAPPRAHRGDDFVVTGYVQGRGLAGKSVEVKLLSRNAGTNAGSAETLEGTDTLVLGTDGQVVPVTFKLDAADVGRRTLRLELKAPEGDLDATDNVHETDVEVVDRKTRVLLFAGGPAREYQFLRNQLFRDSEVKVDVLLQSAGPGISQDANAILDAFPDTAAALAEYDCIVAFDPNWRALSQEQIELLENWVAEQAGGLIVLAGPVYTESWSQAPNMDKIRALYPVEFNKRFALLDSGRFENKQAWPIELTREGLEAEFMWLTEDAATNRQAWADLDGVYGYYAVRGPKDSARVYGRFSDPEASDGDSQPVYFAGHFFGIGRVFYLGSGEMWRARAVEEAYFDRFYIKLIRHVSQGRLLRGSKRGVLLVEQDRYLVGETVDVEAQLYDHELKALEIASVPLDLISVAGTLARVNLVPTKGGRKGSYQGQFVARETGAYRLELDIPDAGDEDRLTRRIEISVADLEKANPQRNDALLTKIAKDTGAKYFVGTDGLGELVTLLPPRPPRVTVLTAAPIPLWDNTKTLFLLCGVLCFEWLVRKLMKLA